MVNYFRCEECGCVWTIRKNDPAWTSIVTHSGRKRASSDTPDSIY